MDKFFRELLIIDIAIYIPKLNGFVKFPSPYKYNDVVYRLYEEKTQSKF